MVIRLVVLDGIKDSVESIDDFICENIFFNLYLLSLRIELGCTDGRIDCTSNRLFV